MRNKIIIAIAILAIAIAGFFTFSRLSHPLLPERKFVDRLIGESTVGVKPPNQIQIILVGDIMLSRNVAAAINKTGDPNLPFEQLSEYLASSDLNFGNLESPYSGSDFSPPSPSLIFNAPPMTVEGLVNHNFQVLSLANNHALDQKLSGLTNSISFLKDMGIKTVGAGKDQEAAWAPAELEINDTKLCFLAASYASANDGGKSRNEYVARVEDLGALKSKILSAKGGSASGGKSACDVIIASMHMGTEYSHAPNQAQIAFAHAAIDAGANVVVGHHPHWIQPVERYGGGIIFYSLGNFIFDQEWSQKTKEGLTVRLTIEDGNLLSAELVPVIIENYCCARLANETESIRILNGISATSTIIK